jgi:phosphonate transport system substrate-binding protein
MLFSSQVILIVLMACGINPQAIAEEEPVRIGIAAMISPKETLNVYEQILLYVQDKIGKPVKMVQRKSYAEMDGLLKERKVEVALICAGPYVKDHDEFGAELLVAPQAYGRDVYYSYILVNINSPIANLKDLRGKSFAFTDPKSNTGCLVPTYMLAKMNEKPEAYFSKVVFSGTHDKSIELVAKNEIDGAAVDHLIWEYLNATNPAYTSKTKIIVKSPPFGMPPLVVHPKLDPKLKAQLKEILLNMHKDPNGKAILKKIFIDKFVAIDEKKYDSIREMQRWIDQTSKTK